MWYPLLLLAIAALCLRYIRNPKPAPWLGSPRTAPSDRPFLWEYAITRKNRPVASRLGISAKPAFECFIEKETAAHRLTKALGFCKEFQSGNAEFDGRAFILSDDPQVLERLKKSPDVQAAITAAFARGMRNIRATATHIIMELEKIQPKFPAADIEPLLDALCTMRAMLQSASPTPPAYRRLQQQLRLLVRRLPAIFLISAFITVMLNLSFGYQLVQWHLLFAMCLKATVIFWLTGVAFLRLIFRHSSYGHEVLLRFVRQVSWSSACFLLPFLWFVNCQYDTSPPEMHDMQVMEKYITATRKNISHHVRVADWMQQGKTLTVPVSEKMYNNMKKDDSVHILTRSGALGMQWIAKVEPEQ